MSLLRKSDQKGNRIKRIELTGEMTYSQARLAFSQAWPNLPVLWYRPTIEHYKEGFPTDEDLEIADDEHLTHVPERKAILRGEMTMQQFHAAVMTAFSLETSIRGVNLHSIWMVTLDDANAGKIRVDD